MPNNKVKDGEYCIITGFSLPISLFEEIDRIRDDVPRSVFLRRAVEFYLENRKKN